MRHNWSFFNDYLQEVVIRAKAVHLGIYIAQRFRSTGSDNFSIVQTCLKSLGIVQVCLILRADCALMPNTDRYLTFVMHPASMEGEVPPH